MRFFKMSNLGNDYIFTFSDKLDESKIKLLCDRHYGIGGDGLVRVYKRGGIYALEIYNSDGSLATFCGNATLSLGFYLINHSLVNEKFSLFSGGEVVNLAIVKLNGREFVKLTLKKHLFYCDNSLISCNSMIEKELKFKVDNKYIVIKGTAIFVGNLHFVIFGKFKENTCRKLAEKINKTEYFPNGVNIEFVNLSGKTANITVFERGSGKTLACGSGLAAVAFAMRKIYNCHGIYFSRFEGGKTMFEIKNKEVSIYARPLYLFDGDFKNIQ